MGALALSHLSIIEIGKEEYKQDEESGTVVISRKMTAVKFRVPYYLMKYGRIEGIKKWRRSV